MFGIEDDDINKILFLLQEGKVRLETCDFLNDGINDTEYFEDTSYLQNKTSTSQSEIFFTNIILPKLSVSSALAMKTWLSWDEIDDTELPDDISKVLYASLTYEMQMYKYITANVIEGFLSNNFVPFINFSQCKLTDILKSIDDTSMLSPREKQDLNEKFQPFVAGFPTLKLNILVTGSVEDKHLFPSLQSLLDTKKLPIYEIASIMYQILFTLKIMESYKIQQGDFHLGNILVEILDDEQLIEVGNEKFLTRYIPKIFDFDHGYCKSLGPNPLLQSDLLFVHSINQFRKSQDYYQFICGLLNLNVLEVTAMIKKILPKPSFADSFEQKTIRVPTGTNATIVLNDVQKNGLEALISANPRVVLPQNLFPEFVCLYLKDDNLKLLNINKKDFADKLTDVNEKDEIITKTRFYFMFNSAKNLLTLYTSSYSEPDNISIPITIDQLERLNRFIILNPFVKEGEDDEGRVYINMLKSAINPIVPISLFSDKANQNQKQRIEEADKIYLRMKGTTLTLMGGWQCQPIYDISDRILFPLISLFKRPTGAIKEISKYLSRPKKI